MVIAVVVSLASLCLDLACSPRDFLNRRLSADLISASDTFKAPQLFWLRTGVMSNKDFSSTDFMVLQRRGWIIGTEKKWIAEKVGARDPLASIGEVRKSAINL